MKCTMDLPCAADKLLPPKTRVASRDPSRETVPSASWNSRQTRPLFSAARPAGTTSTRPVSINGPPPPVLPVCVAFTGKFRSSAFLADNPLTEIKSAERLGNPISLITTLNLSKRMAVSMKKAISTWRNSLDCLVNVVRDHPCCSALPNPQCSCLLTNSWFGAEWSSYSRWFTSRPRASSQYDEYGLRC